MKFNEDFEMAVEVVQYFGKRKTTDFVQSGRIAKSINRSLLYLQKVLQKLSMSGIMESKRGLNGGARMRAKSVTLLDVWQAIYGQMDYGNAYPVVMRKPLKTLADSMKKAVVYSSK